MRSIFGVAAAAAATLCVSVVSLTPRADAQTTTTTPVQHVVVIFGENISFDHYFATYPVAQNPPGEPQFTAFPDTPAVNGLSGKLLTNNPNLNRANGADAANPFRLDRSQALTADQNHSYTPEQQSYDNLAMDLFPSKTGQANSIPGNYPPVMHTKGLVMGYFDGNTVTALWNYAQRFAMNDNSYGSTFGPSTPGALNLVAGQTNGIISSLNAPSSAQVADGRGGFTLIGDGQPLGDICSSPTRFQAAMSGKNVGDLLNDRKISWGWFQGGFDLTATNSNGTTGCSRSTVSPVTGLTEPDYLPHHQPFQYYATTKNPNHTRPTSVATIGKPGDAANHQYDSSDFFKAVAAGNMPAVSFLKAPSYQDGHAGYSNPLDEQAFIVNVVNAVEASAFWDSTAVIVAYDDSDGWYDHQAAPILNGSFSPVDALTGPGACGQGSTPSLPGPDSKSQAVNGRCGPGVRMPLVVISPWARHNYVDHTLTTQASVLLFIEQNWNLGKLGGGSFDATANPIDSLFDFSGAAPKNPAKLVLAPDTGLPK